jgi:hypothetical protein
MAHLRWLESGPSPRGVAITRFVVPEAQPVENDAADHCILITPTASSDSNSTFVTS